MEHQILFHCSILGRDVGRAFGVRISNSQTVDDLKDAIKKKKASKLAHVDADELDIYMLLSPLLEDDILTKLKEIADGADIQDAVLLESTKELSFYFPTSPAAGMLHLVIEVPPPQTLGKRKRNDPDAPSLLERWRSRHIKVELPSIAELSRIVDHPLSDDEKIPVSVTRLNGLVSSPIELRDVCTSDDVQLLFQAGPVDSAFDEIFVAVTRGPPPGGGTEPAFISFWDRNLRAVIELLLPSGQSIRNSDENTATVSLRPDYAFLVNKFCPFRGEEKGPETEGDPKKELASKLAWVYDPAPYVLGYYITGSDLNLVAITPPPQGQSLPVVHDIVSADLTLRKNRIKNICRLINLSGLFQSLANLVRPSDVEFVTLKRDNGTIEIAGHSIIKSFTSVDKVERMLRLKSTYTLLKKRQVPYVDALIHSFNTTAILSPRGIAELPRSEEELLSAIICVLTALGVLHKEPSILHRDIRWPNVMRNLNDPLKWFIIDWDDAAVAPTTAQLHFRHSTHSPRVFEDGHGTEVDIWSVGELIVWCRALDISLELQNLANWMQGSTPPSAREALDKIKEYQLSSNPSSIGL